MHFIHVVYARVSPVYLAIALQLVPLSRSLLVRAADLLPRWVIAYRWLAGPAVLMGAADAVSGASAAVSGLTKYVGSTPSGPVTNRVVEPISTAIVYRITVTNAGSDHNKDYYNCIPLPPGLSINTNVGAPGFIIGTPTQPGTYPVTLYAGNTSFPTPATLPATFVITSLDQPPVITVSPISTSAFVNSNVTFSVTATGADPLAYQWRHATTNLPGATLPQLALTRVRPEDGGVYEVVVSNNGGSETSTPATLTVHPLPWLSSPSRSGITMTLTLSGPDEYRGVLWGTTDFAAWTPLATNPIVGGTAVFTHDDPSGQIHCYKCYVAP
jgi:hypothetical protein